jgi:hypothetical protein
MARPGLWAKGYRKRCGQVFCGYPVSLSMQTLLQDIRFGIRRFRKDPAFMAVTIVTLALGIGATSVVNGVLLRPLVGLAGSSLPLGNRVSIDWSVLLFTISAAVFSAMLFGLAPLRYIIRMGVPETLSEAVKGGATRSASLTRAGLVVTQVAVAVLLLVGAGLLLHCFERLVAVAPGFTPDHILIADIPLSPGSRNKPNERIDFYERVLQQTATLPGVRTAGASSLAPVSGTGSAIYFNIRGHPPKNNQYSIGNYRTVSPNYFAALHR